MKRIELILALFVALLLVNCATTKSSKKDEPSTGGERQGVELEVRVDNTIVDQLIQAATCQRRQFEFQDPYDADQTITLDYHLEEAQDEVATVRFYSGNEQHVARVSRDGDSVDTGITVRGRKIYIRLR